MPAGRFSPQETNYARQAIERSLERTRRANVARKRLADALRVTLEMFEAHPELKEIDATWPRGSVYGVVKLAVDTIHEADL